MNLDIYNQTSKVNMAMIILVFDPVSCFHEWVYIQWKRKYRHKLKIKDVIEKHFDNWSIN